MERLTQRHENGTPYTITPLNTSDLGFQCFTGFVAERLAEYEDLKMTASEIRLFLRDFGISLAVENRELKKRLQSVKIRMVNQFDGHCPSCNELLIMGRHKYKYCNMCGQKLDWD